MMIIMMIIMIIIMMMMLMILIMIMIVLIMIFMIITISNEISYPTPVITTVSMLAAKVLESAAVAAMEDLRFYGKVHHITL